MMRILSVIGALFLGGAFLTSCTTSGRVSTFVVLPDTQTYLEQCPEVFESQVDWLVANRKKIDAVFQVGDLTQDNSPVGVYAESFLSYQPSGNTLFCRVGKS